jgi:hypothetical protein
MQTRMRFNPGWITRLAIGILPVEKISVIVKKKGITLEN